MRNFPMGKNLKRIVQIALVFIPAQAFATGFPTIDIANLLQNLLTAQQTLEMWENQIKQMQTFSTNSYSGVNGLLGSNSMDLQTLLNNVHGINYDINSINSQYTSMFPNRASWSNMPQSQYSGYYQNWNTELSSSAQSAMNSQALLTRIQSNNNRAAEILSRSDGADGEVRQLQSQNQMLGVMSGQLSDVTNTLVTSSRVTATAAAVSASKEQASLEAKEKLYNGWTDMGAPSVRNPKWN